MFGLPSQQAQQAARSVAFAMVASPAAAVAYLFVVNPEALGAPVAKLALMMAAGCLAMVSADLSNAIATWALRGNGRAPGEQVHSVPQRTTYVFDTRSPTSRT